MVKKVTKSGSRLKASEVLKYIVEDYNKQSATVREIMDKFGVKYDSAQNMLNRLEKKGLLWSEWDIDERNVNIKVFHLRSVPSIDKEKILEEVLEYCRQTGDPSLKYLPTSVGGEISPKRISKKTGKPVAGGSGILTGWKYIIDILTSMEKL